MNGVWSIGGEGVFKGKCCSFVGDIMRLMKLILLSSCVGGGTAMLRFDGAESGICDSGGASVWVLGFVG